MRALLAEWGLLALADVVVLLVSELVTNAVLHAGSVSSLLVEQHSGGVRVTVRDSSSVLPVQRHASGTATTGRGVALLDDLADSWGAEPADGGKRVWFLVSGGRDPWAAFDADGPRTQAQR